MAEAMKFSAALRQAADLLATDRPSGASKWCQRANARDAADRDCGVFQPRAAAWSLAGAVMRALGPERGGDVALWSNPGFLRLTQHLWARMTAEEREASKPQFAVFDWNDHPRRTRREVVEALRAAAEVEAALETKEGAG